MKFISKLVLILLFIPLFLILLIGITVRFQFLSPSFWQKSFGSNNTYTALSSSINKSLERQTIAEGGRASDVRTLTDLITPENLKDVIERNITNILGYANGKVKEIIVYVPVNKIPKTLLSSNFGKVSEQMKLTDLLKEFNVSGITPAQISAVSRVGSWSWLFFALAIILPILLLLFLYLLIDPGKKLIAPGVALILAGAVTGFVTLAGTTIRINWAKDLAVSSNMGDSLIGIIAPPIMEGTLRVWMSIAVISVIFGVILLFLKKPYNNEDKLK